MNAIVADDNQLPVLYGADNQHPVCMAPIDLPPLTYVSYRIDDSRLRYFYTNAGLLPYMTSARGITCSLAADYVTSGYYIEITLKPGDI